MDARMLRELELFAVANLYGLQAPSAGGDAVPVRAWSAIESSWLFVGAVANESEARLLDAMMAAVDCKRGPEVALDESSGSARIIVALGVDAAASVLGTAGDLASLRGTVHRRAGIPVVVTEHPATLLGRPADKARAWEDLVLARRTAAAP